MGRCGGKKIKIIILDASSIMKMRDIMFAYLGSLDRVAERLKRLSENKVSPILQCGDFKEQKTDHSVGLLRGEGNGLLISEITLLLLYILVAVVTSLPPGFL